MKILQIAIGLCISFFGYSQKASIYARDLVTNDMDTVRFGYDINATINIDTFLGEKDIRNLPLKSLDFRILQRDSTDFYCLHPFGGRNVDGTIVYDSVFYSPSFDSKVNFRPKDSTNRYFELLMHYENNVRFKIEFNTKLKYFLDKIILYSRSCPDSKPIVTSSSDTLLANVETLLFNNYDTGYHMIIVFKDTFNLPTNNINLIEGSYLNTYPNPFKDFLFIETNGEFQQLEISNTQGKLFFKDDSVNGINYFQIKTSSWLPGLYFIRTYHKHLNSVLINKIMKL